jgi:hypothetical protein
MFASYIPDNSQILGVHIVKLFVRLYYVEMLHEILENGEVGLRKMIEDTL